MLSKSMLEHIIKKNGSSQEAAEAASSELLRYIGEYVEYEPVESLAEAFKHFFGSEDGEFLSARDIADITGMPISRAQQIKQEKFKDYNTKIMIKLLRQLRCRVVVRREDGAL